MPVKSILVLLLPVIWFFQPAQIHYESKHEILVKCDEVPELNQEIVAFVDAKMRKKVGNGQCWTLAAQALDKVNATWDGKFKFGTLLDPDTDCVYPGDIIQFKNVRFVTREGNATTYDEMIQHTAIVYQVIEKGHYRIAHQNTEKWGKKVDVSTIDLKTKKKGKIWIYRPTQ